MTLYQAAGLGAFIAICAVNLLVIWNYGNSEEDDKW